MKRVVWLVVLGLVFLSCDFQKLKLPEEEWPEQEIISKTKDRCILIEVYDRKTRQQITRGSGVIIDSNLVLTAAHATGRIGDSLVWQPEECYFMVLKEDTIWRWAEAVECKELADIDVALLKIKGKSFCFEKLLPTDSISSGMCVFWFDQIYKSRPPIQFAEVKKINFSAMIKWKYQKKIKLPYSCLDVQGGMAWPGMSGSAVFDFQGKLVGILVGGNFFSYEGIAVPVYHFREILID